MKTIVNETNHCPSCGKPMPAGALAGLCPACLLAQGAETEGGTNELRLLQMQMIDIKSEKWETMTPTELIERMGHELYGPPRMPSTPGAKPPLTHGFRTRQGNYGLLQITGFVKDQAGVQLRYKLMERAHFQ